LAGQDRLDISAFVRWLARGPRDRDLVNRIPGARIGRASLRRTRWDWRRAPARIAGTSGSWSRGLSTWHARPAPAWAGGRQAPDADGRLCTPAAHRSAKTGG